MRALNRFTVVDFSRLLPGPYCSMLLADLGLRVVRVELPHWPDPLRTTGEKIDGQGFMYWMANRNKESLCLDFRKPEGKKALLRLLAKADVLLEGFRPGMMEKFGLGYPQLSKRFPGLIYCSITGFGRTGEMSPRAGHDINFLAESGFLGAGDSNGSVSFPATQVADLCGSHAAANAVLAALLARPGRRKGGRRIDVAMTEAVRSWLVLPQGQAAASGAPFNPAGPHWWLGRNPFYRLYETKDGRLLCVGALERPFAEALLRELGRPDLIPGIEAVGEADRRGLTRELEAIFRAEPLSHWVKRLCGKDVCVTPVRTPEEADRLFGRLPRSPVRFSKEDYKLRRKPPALGADNARVLSSFGFSQKEIRKLSASGLLKKG